MENNLLVLYNLLEQPSTFAPLILVCNTLHTLNLLGASHRKSYTIYYSCARYDILTVVTMGLEAV